MSASAPGKLHEVQQERRFQILVDAVTDYAIYMLDADGIVANWNSGAHRIKGYTSDEIVGHHFSRFYTEEDKANDEPARALHTSRTQGKYEKEGWRVRKDGSRFWAYVVIDPILDDQGRHIGYAKVTKDMTERRQAQLELEQAKAALFQSQKMETVGQLTGGIAHDFNNLLTIILNNLDLAKRKLTGGRELDLIESAQEAADRGAKLTQQLLSFSRLQTLNKNKESVNRLISGFEAVLRRACGEAIEFVIKKAPQINLAEIDSAHFEVALLNLIVNARDAMPHGGRITIKTEAGVYKLPGVALDGQLCVRVCVTDTGQGMPESIKERVFEPFFTTKDVGKGTGLGLSQVYGFVTQSGGHVSIDSELGEGTTINIYLPALDEVDAQQSEENEAALEDSHKVLIVEDDAGLRLVTVELFQSMGFRTVTAADALEALEILQKDNDIDLLFTDIVMPKGMNGVELAQKAHEIYPELKIMLASGYPRQSLIDKGIAEDVAFISKPYRWTELAERLKSLKLL